MKHSLFLAALEFSAKSIRSGLATVGALVDCGIPRQHAGAQWLAAAEEEIEVWPGRGCGNDAGDGAKQPVAGAHILESPARPGSNHCSYCPRAATSDCRFDCAYMGEYYTRLYGFDAPQDSRTNAGATSSRAVEEGLTEGARPPAAPSVSAADLSWVQHVIPGIGDVLAHHVPSAEHRSERVHCYRPGELWTVCGEFADWQDWRDHVAPEIAVRVEQVTLALPEEA